MTPGRRRRFAGAGALVAALAVAPRGEAGGAPDGGEGRAVPPLAVRSPAPSRQAVASALGRAVAALRAAQKSGGAWGGAGNMLHHETWPNVEAQRSWEVATTGLAVVALLRHGGEAADCRAAVERALDWMVANHRLRRCDDWDIDQVWGWLYATHAFGAAAQHAWFRDGERRAALDGALAWLVARIADYQSPNGGWAYYTDQIACWRPEWATSFTTAAMLLALDEARAAGHDLAPERRAAAVRAVARCRLPNGAFTYDVSALPMPDGPEGINDVRGSLGRIGVCELALIRGGRRAPEAVLARGVDAFFRHHAYLDLARMRPWPHEAYHYNSGYFYFFGHAYLGELLPELDAALRSDAAGKLAFEVIKTQQQDGSFWDYYMSDNTRPYATAYAILALGRALDAMGPAAP